MPWITFDAIDYLEQSLGKNLQVFEYGSGGSTLFWRKFGANCVSIEHDPTWHALVKSRLCMEGNVDYRLVLPDMAESLNVDAANPESFLSADPKLKGYSFKDYVCQIDEFPDDYFDVVMIDGRARPSCIAHGVKKVKLGGIVVLDNAERPYYVAQTGEYLQGFSRKQFSGVGPWCRWMWQTDIYIREKNPLSSS